MSLTVHSTALRVSAVATSAFLLVPHVAVAAEGSPSATDLLLPKAADFIPALIIFLIIWFLLAKFAWPTILGTMAKREQKIEDDIAAAELAKEKAAASERESEEHIHEAYRQAEEIVVRAKKEAEAQRAKILAKAQQDAAEVVAKAHDAVDSERRKAMIELSGSVVELSVDIASKIIGDSLSVEEQRKLAEKYLSEVSFTNDR